MKSFYQACVFLDGKFQTTNVIFDAKIRDIGGDVADTEILPLPDGAFVCPGFIDEHIHGAGGADAMDGSKEALATIASTLAKEGTTSFLATTMTQSKQNILRAMNAVKEYRLCLSKKGARLLGVHLEGPFISAAHKGAQPEEYIALPSVSLFQEFNEASGNAVKIVTLAPEIEGADELVTYLNEEWIIASVGHTSATSAQVFSAVEKGATHVTHTFNAQSPLHHREIGTVGSALLCDDLSTEVICDTVHVSVPAIKLLFKSKPKGKIVLITDAMRAKGLPDGESELGGQKVFVKNGEARLADGTLAGSVLTMNRAIQNVVEKVGIPLECAIECATVNPAHDLGIDGETGSIALGKRADFAVLDKQFNVLYTVRDGEIIYRA